MQARHIAVTLGLSAALATGAAQAQQETDAPMTFFVTSEMHSGDWDSRCRAEAPAPFLVDLMDDFR